jgi:hypothetical protein
MALGLPYKPKKYGEAIMPFACGGNMWDMTVIQSENSLIGVDIQKKEE